MTYIVLARKWRPMLFEDVVGQEHVSHILVNALKNNRVAQAYIFAGSRGVGKTTTARLLAKAVNCENQPVTNPCNKCANCKSITGGQNLDVIEIDGASNRGIDEIRNLRENIRYAPVSLKYKVYIIDEVHMLTKEAFNALLKTLEEPPSHAIFIFATTEIHKVPLTILSRCQRFDFKRIALSKILELLKKIVKAENINAEEDALILIARKAEGSMRDAESILDQMISFGSDTLTTKQIRESLGLIDQEVYFEFTDLLPKHNSAAILEYARKIFNSGHDLIDFIQGLQEHFRNYLMTVALSDLTYLDVPDHYKKKYKSNAKEFNEKDLIHYLHILSDAEQKLKYSALPELEIELLLLKLAHKPASAKLEEILSFIEKIKREPEIVTKTSKMSTEKSVDRQSSRRSPVVTEDAKNLSNVQTNEPENFESLEGTLKGLKNLKNKGLPKTQTKSQDFSLDLADIQAKWSSIIERVRSQKIALGSFLQEGIPYQTDRGKLIIAYDQKATFHQEHVEKNSRVIEEILNQEFKLPIKVSFRTIDFASEGIEIVPRTPEEVLEDIKNKEPIIKKIIDVFDLDESGNKPT